MKLSSGVEMLDSVGIALRHVLQDSHVPPGSDVVLAGSLVEGLSNARSDIDILVFAPPSVTRLMNTPKFIFQAGRRVEVRYYNAGELLSFIQRANSCNVERYAEVASQNFFILNFLHRVKTAKLLAGPGDILESLKAELQVSHFDDLVKASFLAAFYRAHVNGMWSLQLGAFEQGWFFAWHALWCAVQSYLADRGDTYGAQKFALIRLEKLHTTPRKTIDAIGVLARCEPTGEGSIRTYCEEVLLLATKHLAIAPYETDLADTLIIPSNGTEVFRLGKESLLVRDRRLLRVRGSLGMLPAKWESIPPQMIEDIRVFEQIGLIQCQKTIGWNVRARTGIPWMEHAVTVT
jgi:hypothetical protein